MLELYGGGPSRWLKCYWMLKEIGQEFKEHTIDFYKNEQKSPHILALNPFGKVPILKDGEKIVCESSAILNYLGDKFPESGLVPKSGTAERAHCDQWLFFSVTDLEQPLWRITKHSRLYPENLRIPEDIELATMEFKRVLKTLNELIGDKRFLVANQFSAADISMGYTLRWAQALRLLDGFANVERYAAELWARPHFPKNLFPV